MLNLTLAFYVHLYDNIMLCPAENGRCPTGGFFFENKKLLF